MCILDFKREFNRDYFGSRFSLGSIPLCRSSAWLNHCQHGHHTFLGQHLGEPNHTGLGWDGKVVEFFAPLFFSEQLSVHFDIMP